MSVWMADHPVDWDVSFNRNISGYTSLLVGMEIQKLFMNYRGILFLILLLLVGIDTQARRLAGFQAGREVAFDTTLIQSVEYVNAKELLAYFPNAYDYDALASVIKFYRNDNTSIGIMAGDFRVVIDNTVRQMPNNSIRQNGSIYIPLDVVDAFLFPQMKFHPSTEVVENNGAGYQFNGVNPQETPSQFVYATPTPNNYDIVPFGITPTPQPVNQMYEPSIPPSSLIVLDPGNDPKNPGAGASLAYYEEDFTLLICEKLKQALEETQSYTVELTRTRSDTGSITNMQRSGLANAKNAAVFISIQCGGMYSSDVSRACVYFMNNYIDYPVKTSPNIAMGLQTPWYSSYETNQNESYRLAQLLIQELNPFYELRKIIQLDENPRPGRLAVLRGLTMPGVLIELGNLNHSLTTRHLFLSEQITNELVYELEQAISNYLYTRSGIQQLGIQN